MPRTVEQLLAVGLDPDARFEHESVLYDGRRVDDLRHTALTLACAAGSPAIVKILLKAGASATLCTLSARPDEKEDQYYQQGSPEAESMDWARGRRGATCVLHAPVQAKQLPLEAKNSPWFRFEHRLNSPLRASMMAPGLAQPMEVQRALVTWVKKWHSDGAGAGAFESHDLGAVYDWALDHYSESEMQLVHMAFDGKEKKAR